jgi:glycosyltransferase involved in cell wall biosynthesis
MDVLYNYVGSRRYIPGFLIFPLDLVKFIFKCLFKKIDLVVINPSLNRNAIIREAIYLRTAYLLNKKTIVFWHGWLPEMVEKINKNSNWFVSKFSKSSNHIVLAESFKNDLIRWGVKCPIYISTTKVDDDLIAGFDLYKKQKKTFTILFLSRIEVYKGIFIVLEAYKQLYEKHLNINLLVVGDGTQLNSAKDFSIKNGLKNIHFLGNLNGKELSDAFQEASIYVLPTYSEGMPTSVLEAMAFGLPVITRPVGGINDFFEEGKMGYLIESMNPEEYAKKISHLIENKSIVHDTGLYNYKYANSNFLASKVVMKLESIFKNA